MIYVLFVPYWSVCILSYKKYESSSSPPASFLWFPLNLPAVLFYYVFTFAASLNHITDLPLELKIMQLQAFSGTEKVSSP